VTAPRNPSIMRLRVSSAIDWTNFDTMVFRTSAERR